MLEDGETAVTGVNMGSLQRGASIVNLRPECGAEASVRCEEMIDYRWQAAGTFCVMVFTTGQMLEGKIRKRLIEKPILN
eukprot:764601-Hanusia_phi.AAC.2